MRQLIGTCFIVLFTADAGRAQSDRGTLVVRVIDAAALATPGATVAVRQFDTNTSRELVSDSDGRAVFTLLPPGPYEVTVSLSGFKQFRNSGLRLQVAQTASIETRLEPGDVSDAVEVVADVPLVNVNDASQGTVISEATVHALPLNGRQFIQLALLVPGANGGGRAVQQNVVRQNQVGGLSVSGGRTTNTAFLLDGAVNTDPDYNSLN